MKPEVCRWIRVTNKTDASACPPSCRHTTCPAAPASCRSTRHGHRIARIQHHNRVRIRLSTAAISSSCPRQVHRFHVEALTFELRIASHHDHGTSACAAASVASFSSFVRASAISCAGSSPSIPRPARTSHQPVPRAFLDPSSGVIAYFGRTSELPPPPVRATAAFGPMTAME